MPLHGSNCLRIGSNPTHRLKNVKKLFILLKLTGHIEMKCLCPPTEHVGISGAPAGALFLPTRHESIPRPGVQAVTLGSGPYGRDPQLTGSAGHDTL